MSGYEEYSSMVAELIIGFNEQRITTEEYCHMILDLIDAYEDVVEIEMRKRRHGEKEMFPLRTETYQENPR